MPPAMISPPVQPLAPSSMAAELHAKPIPNAGVFQGEDGLPDDHSAVWEPPAAPRDGVPPADAAAEHRKDEPNPAAGAAEHRKDEPNSAAGAGEGQAAGGQPEKLHKAAGLPN